MVGADWMVLGVPGGSPVRLEWDEHTSITKT